MVVYIHPQTRMFLKEIIPFGVPGLVNRLRQRFPVRGFFFDEWPDEAIRSARVVLFDIHWYLSIPGALRLSYRLKEVNPDIKIIAGGISATLFARQILRDSAIDYIVRGDALGPLESLVTKLVSGESPDDVPNVVSRQFENPITYQITQEEFGEANFNDITWFPSLKKRAAQIQRAGNGMAWPVHPLLVMHLGCAFKCACQCYGGVERLKQAMAANPDMTGKACYAATDSQKRLFGRGLLIRPAEKMRQDFISWKEDPDVRSLYTASDFCLLPPQYAEKVLDQEYGLDVHYVFYSNLPTERMVDLICGAFRGGDLIFVHHWMDPDVQEAFVQRVRQAKAARRFRVWLAYSRAFSRNVPGYAESLEKVKKATGCLCDQMDEWWDYAPNVLEGGLGSEEQYQECLSREYYYTRFNYLYWMSMQCQKWFPRLNQGVIALRRSHVGDLFRKRRL